MDSSSIVQPLMVSDSAPTPRGSSAECRQNAQRGRQQSDWFSHEGSSISAPQPQRLLPPSSNTRPTSPTHAAGLSSVETRDSSTVPKRYFKSGADPQTWYKYGSDFKDEIIGQAYKARNVRGTTGDGSDVKKKMTECHSNNWFRHEHTGVDARPLQADARGGKKQPISVRSSESANSPWVTKGEPNSKAAVLTPRPETAEYMRRHKADKSLDWFSHDHAGEPNEMVSVHHSKGGNKECAENAARQKGESSKDWFSHENSAKYFEPKPVPKLTSPEAKLLMERSKGDEIKQVFRMDQNLKVTWTAPSDEPSKDVEKNSGGSKTLVEKFLTNQNSVTKNGNHNSNVNGLTPAETS